MQPANVCVCIAPWLIIIVVQAYWFEGSDVSEDSVLERVVQFFNTSFSLQTQPLRSFDPTQLRLLIEEPSEFQGNYPSTHLDTLCTTGHLIAQN